MKFFSSLYHSLFDVEWLRARRVVAGKAWGYFFVLLSLASFIGIGIMAVYVPRGIKEVKKFIQEQVPANFEATISSGTLSITGVPQPYVFKDDKESQFVVVVDTVATNTLSLKDYLQDSTQSGVLVDRAKIELFDAQSLRGQTQYWRDIPDTAFDRQTILSAVDKVGPGLIALFLVLFVVVLFIVLVVGALFNILLVSVIVLIIASIAHREWKFGELFTVGLYAITLPFLISLVLQLLGVSIPYVQFLALLAFMLAVVFTKSVVSQSKDAVVVQDVHNDSDSK